VADDEEEAEETPEAKPKTRRRRRAPATGGSRFERRAGKITETLTQATKWTIGGIGDKDLDFTHTVERDAQKIGHAFAAIGEWFDPVGKLLDVVFGLTGPLAVFVGLSPTLQAARRSGQERLAQWRERKQREVEELEQQQNQYQDGQIAADLDWPTDTESPVETFTAVE
jgi:hypothetical protein